VGMPAEHLTSSGEHQQSGSSGEQAHQTRITSISIVLLLSCGDCVKTNIWIDVETYLASTFGLKEMENSHDLCAQGNSPAVASQGTVGDDNYVVYAYLLLSFPCLECLQIFRTRLCESLQVFVSH
jgi:hypothetical protein